MQKEQLSYRIGQAATLLGVSRDYFDDHIRADLKLIRRGQLVLVPRSEIEKWLEQNAERALA